MKEKGVGESNALFCKTSEDQGDRQIAKISAIAKPEP
jgi:hypothetical protein